MDLDNHPAANPELHGRAEQAALEAYLAADDSTPPQRLMRIMDRAAAKSFKAAGVPNDIAVFYASCVTSLVLERMHNMGPGSN